MPLSLKEQLAQLSDEEVEALQQELLRQQQTGEDQESKASSAIQEEPAPRDNSKRNSILAKGAVEGLASFGEGALLGFQGRPISELSALQDEKKSKFDLETFRSKERIKKEIKQEFEPEKKESFDEASVKASNGEISFDDLRQQFPLKRDKIDNLEQSIGIESQRKTPVSQSEGFTKGTGGLISRVGSFVKPTQAEITPKTQTILDQIETEGDLDDLLSREAEAKEKGIDVDAVYEFFGLTAAMVLRRKEEIKEGAR